MVFFVVWLWGFLFAFCFARCPPQEPGRLLPPAALASPLPAAPWPGPGSLGGPQGPAPFPRCPAPGSRSAGRCWRRAAHPAPARLPAPSAPAGPCFCGFYVFLGKGIKWRNLGLPAAERCSEAQPLRGCGAGTPGAGGPWQHPSCGRAACAGGRGWGGRWLFGGQWWPPPLAWG